MGTQGAYKTGLLPVEGWDGFRKETAMNLNVEG